MINIEKMKSYTVKNVTYENCHITNLATSIGHTLGNSLRRTILTLTPGIAIVGAKFSCFKHEFDSCDDIIESASAIIDNLKNVLFRYNSEITEEIKEIKFTFKGKKQVKAGDIETKELQVVNKELELFNVTKDNAEIVLHLYFNSGVGFKIFNENQKLFEEMKVNKSFKYGIIDSSVIGVTSVYSRVNKVTYELLDKNNSFRNYEEIIFSLEQDNIYPDGFILRSAIEYLLNTYKNFSYRYKEYEQELLHTSTVRIEILNYIDSNYSKEVANFFNAIEFNNYSELNEILLKLTYRKCKLTKENFNLLCEFIKSKV